MLGATPEGTLEGYPWGLLMGATPGRYTRGLPLGATPGGEVKNSEKLFPIS